jgi:hypothetical protein
VVLSADAGHRKLSGETFTEGHGTDRHGHTVTDKVWHDLLRQKFGLHYGAGRSG